MGTHHDLDAGWVTHSDDTTKAPIWRATSVAYARIMADEVRLEPRVNRVRVITLQGRPIGRLQWYPQHHKVSVTLEGWTWWRFNRVLQREHFDTVAGFDRMSAAIRFLRDTLKSAHARLEIGRRVGAKDSPHAP